MDLKKLKAMPTAELVELYNDLAGKQVKRMASRADAERRTMEAAQAAGKWEGPTLAGKGKSAGKGKEQGNPPAEGKGKAPAHAAKASSSKAKASRGAPRKNLHYTAKEADVRMNPSSARTKVYDFVNSKKDGADRETIIKHFDGEDVNVDSSLGYLVKVKLLKAKEA